MNIFDCAIKIEEETREFLEELEAESGSTELKRLFGILADSEAEFRDRVMRLRNRIPATASMEELDASACSFKAHLTQRELLHEVTNDPDLYRLIVGEEEHEIEWLERIAATTDNEITKRCLLMLAAEARKHLQTVENVYEFVEAPKHYLAWSEFGNRQEL
jgi:rubrerythrin